MKKILLLLLFMFFSCFIYALDKNIILPPEGEYNENIKLELKTADSNILFYFENSISNDPLLFDTSENPVILTAAEGEEKNYRISFKEKGSSDPPLTLNYTIDRLRPLLPELIISNNFISFSETDNSIFYRINRDSWNKWNGNKIKLSEINTLFYYSMDSAGNKSSVKTWSNQHFDNYRTSENNIKVLSPVKGDFYNKQILYINHTGFEWIRYSYKNKKSALSGNIYTKPITVDKTGSINIFIAAKPFNSGNTVFKEISFNVKEDNEKIKTDFFSDKNEYYLTAASSKIILYSLNSRTYSRYESPVKLISDKSSVNTNTVYFKNYDDKSSYTYRYFYYFDNRNKLSGKSQSNNKNKTYNPEKPVLSGIKTFPGGGKQIYLRQKKDVSYIYSVKENKAPLNPVMNSYVTDILPVLRNPYGRESTYYVKISAVDLEGNISEPLEVNNINVDHYPPSVPDISVVNNTLVFKSRDKVFYKITSEGSKNTFFKEYEKPVYLQSVPGISENFSFHYYSSDRSGNKSRTKTYLFKLDNSFPYLISAAGIKENNYLNNDYILKKSFFNNDYKIYYSYSENLTPPPDPDLSSAVLENDIILKCPEGEEKHYTFKFLPLSLTNSYSGDIKEIHFHIDKIKPALPDLSDMNSIYYSDNAVINIKGAVRGNTVYYSYSDEPGKVKSPFEGKNALYSSIVIPHQDKSRKKYYFRTGSEDKAGNKNESQKVYSLIIDNRDYPVKILENINSQIISDHSVSVNRPDDDFIYRYQISNNKDSLGHVDYKSDIIDTDLLFMSEKDEEKVFYLAVKAYFDEKDRKGSNERIITVITDRKKPDKPEIIISDNNEIEIKGENTVLYSAYPEKSGNIKPEYQKYSSPFKLNKYIPPGRYIIKAYSRDTAGNISDPAVDSFYISRKILFISQTAGSDSNTGTSYNSPLKTLDQAFDLYRENKADTFILMPGNYIIKNQISVESTLFIKGSSNKTYINSAVKNKNSHFNIKNSAVIFKDIILQSSEFSSSFLSSDNSLIVFDNTDVSMNCSSFLDLNNSSLIIEDSDITLKTVIHSIPFILKSGKMNITDSSFNISSSSGIISFQLSDSYSKIANSSIYINSDETVFTESYNSIIRNSNLRLKIESGGFSDFFNAEKSRIRIDNSFFSDSPDSEKSIFMNSNTTDAEITDTNINLNSSFKSSLINALEGEFVLDNLLTIIDTSDNTMPLISADNTVFSIKNNDISFRNKVHGGFITSNDSIFEIYSSNIKSSGEVGKYIMDFKGHGSALLKNNIFEPDTNLIRKSSGISVIRE